MIVENISTRSQTHLGKLTPRAPQDRFTSAWAVREGPCPSGWNTIRDYADGLAFGEHLEKKIQFSEYKDQGQTNDVEFNGLKLREVVVERKFTTQKDKMEAEVSNRRTREIETGKRSSEGMVSTLTEVQTGRIEVPVAPTEVLDQSYPIAHSTPKQNGWTPERRARQEATLAAKKAKATT